MRYIGIVLSIAFAVPATVLAQSQELKHAIQLFLREEPASPAMRELQTLHRKFVQETVLYFPVEQFRECPRVAARPRGPTFSLAPGASVPARHESKAFDSIRRLQALRQGCSGFLYSQPRDPARIRAVPHGTSRD